MIGNTNNETDFPHKLLLTDSHVSMICKTLTDHLLASIKLSKILLSKIVQSGGFLVNFLDQH